MTAKNIIGGVIGLALAVAACWFVYALTYNQLTIGYNQGYEPIQPIEFPHDLHAGKLGLDCKYCHTTAEVSRHASVPPLNICMNCHMTVHQMDGKDSAAINYVVDHFNNNQPILWQKVHMLPDFVKFNHSAHIKAGKQCQECHGPVQDMKRVRQVASLSMGWCVNCHRKQENHAPTNCGACHY